MSGLHDDVRAQMLEILPRLRRFGYTLTNSKEEADDLVQATLEKALRYIDQWQVNTRLDSWMFRIAKNIWIDQIRSMKSRGEQIDFDSIAEINGEDGDKVIESQLMLEKTHAAVAELPEEQRGVIALISVEGLSYREAAEVLEIPVGTVMSRLARARKVLAEKLLSHSVA